MIKTLPYFILRGESMCDCNNVKLDYLMLEIKSELTTAMRHYPNFASYHEGYAFLLEEVDELWKEIKSKRQAKALIYKEAKQVAAMAMRIMFELC